MQSNTTIPNPKISPCISIPRAGQLLGLNKDAAYRAAHAGRIPTIATSPCRKVVPTAILLKMLGMDEWVDRKPITTKPNESSVKAGVR